MMDQIHVNTVQLCKQILSLVTPTFRPIHLKELGLTADLPRRLSTNLQWLNQLVDLCSSFLTVQEETFYFIHQSAKDYFSIDKGPRIFLLGQAEEHCKIVNQSLQVMSDTLRKGHLPPSDARCSPKRAEQCQSRPSSTHSRQLLLLGQPSS
jgi:hypothetical protein